MKYYAVKKGKPKSKPAVYTSWDECKAEVQGVSGAIYKSFKTEAEAYAFIKPDEEYEDESSKTEINLDKTANDLNKEEGLLDKLNKKDVLYAYVDGSYNKNEKISGYGMALVINDEVIYEAKGTLRDENFVQYRNVYGEVKGTEEAIKLAIKKGFKEVNVVYDYTGIENWALGNWKANNDLTKGYAKLMSEFRKIIKIKFIKVKAHAKESDGGHKYNDLVDKLAKESVGVLK